MKNKKIVLLASLVAIAAIGCMDPAETLDSTDSETEQSEPVTPHERCHAAEGELGQLSCAQNEPVNEAGLTASQLGLSLRAPSTGGDFSTSAHRTYTGGCTGIWYGCSRVTAEGYRYESCGTSHYVYMTFDGPVGNLIAWGTGYCWF